LTAFRASAAWLPQLLPIPTDDHSDVAAVLRAQARQAGPRIDILVGPDDTGKSALLRALASDYRAGSHDFRLVDLSITTWRELVPAPGSCAEIIIVDHIDRINDPNHFSAAFDILDRILPVNVSNGTSTLILSVSLDWRATFRSIYRLNPETILRRAIPTLPFKIHYIRPYDDAELTVLCRSLNLDPNSFADLYLRKSGVLAMASAVVSEPGRLTGASLREVLAMRWVQAGHDAIARAARRAIWVLMGTHTLQHGTFSIGLSELYAELRGIYATSILREQLGGPTRWEGDQLQPDSPSWSDVAAAKALDGIINGRASAAIPIPMRSTVLDALIDLNEPASLAGQIERKLLALQGSDFDSIGYLGAILATVLAQVSSSDELVLRSLHLQGPDHQELRTVEPGIAEIVEDALLSSLQASVGELLTMLQHVVRTAASAHGGGYECWEAVRAWARKLPLRAAAENALSNLLPRDGSWHYEDILDVSVTQATTRLMANSAEVFSSALAPGVSDANEYLADIWDGINDGAWDQIDATSSDFVSALKLPSATAKVLDVEACSLQRARLGIQDATRWRLVNSDLFLADLRSCRNLEKAEMAGSNWWSAIMPPPARYYLSRSCRDDRFIAWCEAPPWRNPYFSASWPTPFE
jgi:hypothetical protein